MIEAKKLRSKEMLSSIPNKPGYYIWWAKKEDFENLLKGLGVDEKNVLEYVPTKEGLYAIYVGTASQRSLRERIIGWHINDPQTKSRIRKKTLSTLRQSISSVLFHDQLKKKETDEIIDRMSVEYFCSEHALKSKEAKNEVEQKETELLGKNLYILNIKKNNHFAAVDIKQTLLKLREEGRKNYLN